MIGLNALREARKQIVKLFNAFDIFRKQDAPRLRIEKYEQNRVDDKCYPTKLNLVRPSVKHQAMRRPRIVKKVIR